MAVKPSEYKSGSVKEITLPSGEKWRIRRIPFDALSEFITILGLKFEKGKAPTQIEQTFSLELDKPDFKNKLVQMTKIVLPACSVDPKIILSGDSSDDYILYSEIKPMHVFDLFFEMLDFSDLSEAAMKGREKFQQESDGKTS